MLEENATNRCEAPSHNYERDAHSTGKAAARAQHKEKRQNEHVLQVWRSTQLDSPWQEVQQQYDGDAGGTLQQSGAKWIWE
mmetsp:Transcript_152685/g.266098  ORF Transcript_152685/g.266098 Transcript_152685/m.266098 type:complete len:81 (+) Transcript_152685:219-461(+)